jgi:hypothetical protein
LAAAAAVSAANPVCAQLLLDADFDDKTINAPIGTGGAAVGEPSLVTDVTAIVRGSPFTSPSLEIQDDDDYYSGYVDFDFLEEAEISSGFVSAAFDMWFPTVENYILGVRESGSATCYYLDLEFQDDGDVKARDSAGNVSIDSTYPTGRVVPVEIVFDMDAGTYDLFYDGSLVLDDRAHGVESGCGVGSVYFGISDDPDFDGAYSVDNISVTAYLFRAGFEAGDVSEWSIAVGGGK